MKSEEVGVESEEIVIQDSEWKNSELEVWYTKGLQYSLFDI